MPHALVTSGPTYEPIDPVRFIGNRSSGKQGHAIAVALKDAGFAVTLVTGPVQLADPEGITTIHINTAEEMLTACLEVLPVDVAVCAAAVSDWRAAQPAEQKIKKEPQKNTPPACGGGRGGDVLVPSQAQEAQDNKNTVTLTLTENPDILHNIAHHPTQRPKLVIGFAAETERVLEHAQAKLARKGCDWIVANQVSAEQGFGQDDNDVTLITAEGAEAWPKQSKQDIARALVQRMAQTLG